MGILKAGGAGRLESIDAECDSDQRLGELPTWNC